MALIDVERAVLCVCFKAEVPEELLASLGDRRTWMLYREMVRGRLRKELRVALPRTCREAGAAALERAFSVYLDRTPPRTRFFREVVLEFVAQALPVLAADVEVSERAPWISDLARYEAALWEVSDLDARETGTPAEFGFERAPWLSPALRVLELEHAVHLGRDQARRYRAAPTYLCVHRASDGSRPRTWNLNRSTYELLRLWLAEPSLSVRDAVQQLAQTRAFVVDDVFVDGLCGVLAEFLENGIVLGSR